MDKFAKTVLFSSFFILCFIALSNAQNCPAYTFSNGNRSFRDCNSLPVLDSFLHWNYHQSNHTVDIAYRHTRIASSNWVAWALNPGGTGMRGAQSLVAFINSTGAVHAYTSPIADYFTTLREGPLSFRVPSIAAEFTNNQMIIYATIELPVGNTSFAQVWQHGDVSEGTPQRHLTTGDHMRSVGNIDFASAATSEPSTPTARAPPAPPVGTVPPSSGRNNCPAFTFSNGNRSFRECNSLPVLDSFLHWNYHQRNHTVDIAYRHTGVTSSNWVAWALNPGGTNMLGAQALVASFNSSGSIHAYTSPITSYSTTLQEGPLSFRVPSISAEFVNNQMIIYATIELPAGSTRFTQVWQHGDVSGTTPQRHLTTGDHMRSIGTIDFATGLASDTGSASGGSRQRRRNVHGVLSVVSWGILMPLGAMAARYLKVFKSANPAWFYLHVTCQTSAYIVGVAGWGTGLKLGSDSAGVEQTTHKNIGIALFTLATLQAFALLLRPKPDHKYRFHWNIYHHAIGYSVIVLTIINIFEGFDILDPEKKWKRAYTGVLIFLGASAALLEAITWFIVFRRKGESSSDKHPQHTTNGVHA